MFFTRHDITLKKSLQATERDRVEVRPRRRWIAASKACLIPPGWGSLMRLLRLRGRAPRSIRLIGCVPLETDHLRGWLASQQKHLPDKFKDICGRLSSVPVRGLHRTSAPACLSSGLENVLTTSGMPAKLTLAAERPLSLFSPLADAHIMVC
jgi:hypothetical protein